MKRAITFRQILSSMKRTRRILFSEKYLLYTNTGISCGISICADIVQQKNVFVKRNGDIVAYDKSRTAKMAACGLMCGPVCHFWYIFLDRLLPGKGAKIIAQKVFLDQVICSPLFICLYLAVVESLDKKEAKSSKQELSHKAARLYIGDAALWIPAQIVNFSLLPPQYRVLFDNVVSLLSDIIYSYVLFDY